MLSNQKLTEKSMNIDTAKTPLIPILLVYIYTYYVFSNMRQIQITLDNLWQIYNVISKMFDIDT